MEGEALTLMAHAENEAIDREILEAIKRHSDNHSNVPAGVESVISQTSLGRTPRPLRENRWRFDRLDEQRMIRIVAENSGSFAMELRPRGYERLSMTEEEYQGRQQPPSSTHFTTTIHGDVGRLAQAGSGSTISQHDISGADFQQVTKLIERLVSEIKTDPEIPDNTKQGAELRADELKTELQSSHPNLERIKTVFAWLNTLAVTYAKFEPLVNAVIHTGCALVGIPKTHP